MSSPESIASLFGKPKLAMPQEPLIQIQGQPLEDPLGVLSQEEEHELSKKEATDQFLRHFILLPMNGELTVRVTCGEGALVIKRLRVRLSRLRALAKKQNKRLKYFMLLTVSNTIVETDEGDMDEVVVKKGEHRVTKINQFIKENIDLISE